MLREKATSQQNEYEIVLLEELVLEDHLVRKIDKAVDFSFIHDLCNVEVQYIGNTKKEKKRIQLW